MPIQSLDIKLLTAERLLDTSDGGGRITGNVVENGRSNNLFSDISELDRTYGRVSLRKCFIGIHTDDVDSYYGAHIIFAQPPSDSKISVALFTTKSWTDQREAAKDRIETYLARSVKWPGQLLERQLAGQRAIALLLKPADPLPKIGQSLVLIQNEGKPNEVEQYVRVTRVSTNSREFNVSDGGSVTRFQGVVATCEISDPLRTDFEGPAPSLRDDNVQKAVVRDTVVANAAVYYGIAPTQSDATLGATQLSVSSIFTQLVPSAQTEIAVVDQIAGGLVSTMIPSGRAQISNVAYFYIGNDNFLYLVSGILPGSLKISFAGYEFSDREGKMMIGETVVGTIDYGRGSIAWKNCPVATWGYAYIYFYIAAEVQQQVETAAIAITAENRGFNYTITLSPIPQSKSIKVSYLSQGNWIDLVDGGRGILRGSDVAFGAGKLDTVTGSLVITLGALPDVGSSIIFSWASPSVYFNRTNSLTRQLQWTFKTKQPGIIPGTLKFTWSNTQSLVSATDNGHGQLSGRARGSVKYALGEIVVIPDTLPPGGAEVQVEYDYGPPEEMYFEHPIRGADGQITLKLKHTDIRASTVEVEFNLLIENYEAISTDPAEMVVRIDPIKIFQDTGDGKFNGSITGSIDYTAGTLTFKPDTTVSIPFARYAVKAIGRDREGKTVYRNTFSHFEYKPAGAFMPFDESGWVKVRYRPVDSPTSATETFKVNALELDLTEQYGEQIVPGSLSMIFGGKGYVDRLGQIVCDYAWNNNVGVQGGTINYDTGAVSITNWNPGHPNNPFVFESLLTRLNAQPVDEVNFKVTAPVRPGSIQVRAVGVDGKLVSATSAANGLFDSAGIAGEVDYQTGVVRLRFGQWVPATSVSDQPWFVSEAVKEGRYFKPMPVLADTLRYNSVSFSYLPLSSDVLGLDPVRLPSDGRVPIFRPGDVAVVHHTARTPVAVTAAGGTVQLGRPRVSSVRCYDSTGKDLPTDYYTTDLDAGTVTIKSNWGSAGMTLPLQIEHRIEDMALITDAQINGSLSLSRPLSHFFPKGETLVSSALIVGDLQARVHTMFSQQTWTNEWSDSRIGANTISQYNQSVYPPVVTNRGSIEERWALIFFNTTDFRVIGESVGQIATGSTALDLAPLNPETQSPYFTLKAAGWGNGWSAGNVYRFNTAGANYPLWIARTVLQGPASLNSDQFQLQIRGDIDR